MFPALGGNEGGAEGQGGQGTCKLPGQHSGAGLLVGFPEGVSLGKPALPLV